MVFGCVTRFSKSSYQNVKLDFNMEFLVDKTFIPLLFTCMLIIQQCQWSSLWCILGVLSVHSFCKCFGGCTHHQSTSYIKIYTFV